MLSDRLRLRDVRNTSIFRLTLLLGLVFAAGLAALVSVIYILSARELTVRNDRVLRLEAAVLSSVSADTLADRIKTELAHNTSRHTYLALQSPDGRLLAGNLHATSEFPIGRPVDVAARPGRQPPLRVLAIRAPGGETILIGRDITPVLDLRRRVKAALLSSSFAIALLVLLAGVALSLPPLRRLRDLQAVSREIAAGALDRRMPLSGRGDELDLFAGTVNAMIGEVARVVAQVKEVTDAIAHDLRTPLTRVRAQLHRLEALAAADPAARALAGAAIADLDIVLERFAALLRISELEALGRQARFAAVALGPLLAEICDLYEPLAEDADIAILCEAGAVPEVRGDRQLLFEAISNLVDNAVKFSPAGGVVTLCTRSADDAVLVEVADTGPGVPAAEREAVLRRFHRGTATGQVPGSGLGLSVVAAIVHLHGFALELDDAAPGLIARIRCRPAGPAAE